MKRKFITSSIGAATLWLASCAAPFTPQSTPTPQDQTVPAASSPQEAACQAEGGNWQRVGRMGKWVCVKRMPDAGKTCNDKTDCHGACQAKPDAQPMSRQAGTCQATTHDYFGCYSTVRKGVVQPMVCVD